MVPEFTTSNPGFMGSTEDHNRAFVESKKGPRSLFTKNKQITIYLHGETESRVGFDIPIFLSGDIVECPQQPVIVWMPDGSDSFDAVLVMEERRTRWYGLIVTPAEVPALNLSVRLDLRASCTESFETRRTAPRCRQVGQSGICGTLYTKLISGRNRHYNGIDR